MILSLQSRVHYEEKYILRKQGQQYESLAQVN